MAVEAVGDEEADTDAEADVAVAVDAAAESLTWRPAIMHRMSGTISRTLKKRRSKKCAISQKRPRPERQTYLPLDQCLVSTLMATMKRKTLNPYRERKSQAQALEVLSTRSKRPEEVAPYSVAGQEGR